jgi:hypothetical protein
MVQVYLLLASAQRCRRRRVRPEWDTARALRHGDDELTGGSDMGWWWRARARWPRGATVRVGGGAAATDGDARVKAGGGGGGWRCHAAAAPTGSLPPASRVRAVDVQGRDLAGANKGKSRASGQRRRYPPRKAAAAAVVYTSGAATVETSATAPALMP